MRGFRGAVIGLVLAAAACGGESPFRGAEPMVRDSAGVTIVENAEPGWGPIQPWEVFPEPELALGTLDGPDETQFYNLRAVRITPEGTLIVPEAGRHRVSAFAGDGTFLWTQGRQGGGPGEYESLASAHLLSGDSVVVLDSRSRRLTVVDPAGEFIRSLPLPTPEEATSGSLLGLAGDNRLVFRANTTFGGEGEVTNGSVERRGIRTYMTRPDGTLLGDSLPVFPGPEMWLVANESFVSIAGFPFGRSSAVAVGPGVVARGVTEIPEVGIFDAAGSLQRIVRFPAEDRAVTDSDWETAFLARLGDDPDPDEVNRLRAFYNDIPVPESWPHMESIRVDDLGYLWVKEYGVPGADDEPSRWRVVDPEGVWLGTLLFPPGFTVDQIRGDRVVGRSTDDFGVEQVRVYRITGREG